MAAAQTPRKADKGVSLGGVSLGQDAWRRLRKSRVAMLCLGLLVAIIGSAFFTPLLPFQPPDAINTPRQYAPPQL